MTKSNNNNKYEKHNDPDLEIAIDKILDAIWSDLPDIHDDMLETENNSTLFQSVVVEQGTKVSRAIDRGDMISAHAMMQEFGMKIHSIEKHTNRLKVDSPKLTIAIPFPKT